MNKLIFLDILQTFEYIFEQVKSKPDAKIKDIFNDSYIRALKIEYSWLKNYIEEEE